MVAIEKNLHNIVWQYGYWNDCKKKNYFETSSYGIEFGVITMQGGRKDLQGIEYNDDESLVIHWTDGENQNFANLSIKVQLAMYRTIKQWHEEEEYAIYLENCGEC